MALTLFLVLRIDKFIYLPEVDVGSILLSTQIPSQKARLAMFNEGYLRRFVEPPVNWLLMLAV